MRRLTGLVFVAALLAPAGLAVVAAVAGADAEALRCAIACGHGATPGAKCCPMPARQREAGPRLQSCPQGNAQIVPAPAAPQGLVPAVHRLVRPEMAASSAPAYDVLPKAPSLAPPDHVPLLLS